MAKVEVVIYQAPKYIPGSGPPLQALSVLPPNDRDGKILEYIPGNNDARPRYIVGYEDQPLLTVSVRPDKILDWVSAWTYEQFEFERFLEIDRLEEEARARRLAAKTERMEKKRKMNEELARVQGKKIKLRGSSTPGGAEGVRKRARPPVEGKHHNGPPATSNSRNVLGAKDVTARKSRSSFSQASLSTPRRPARGLAEPVVLHPDTEEEEEEAIEDALTAQLLGNITPSMEVSESSDDPLTLISHPSGLGSTSRKSGPSARSSDIRNYFYESAPESLVVQGSHRSPMFHRQSRGTPNGKEHSSSPRRKRRGLSSSNGASLSRAPDSVATPRAAEKTNGNIFPSTGPGDEDDDVMLLDVRSVLTKQSQNRHPHVSEDEGDDAEPLWEVKRILDDEVQRTGTINTRYYLVDWEGGWDATWEPEDNLSEDIKLEYHQRKQRKEAKAKNKSRKKTKKQATRRISGFDGAADQSEDDEESSSTTSEGRDLETKIDLVKGYKSGPDLLFVKQSHHGSKVYAEKGNSETVAGHSFIKPGTVDRHQSGMV